MEMDSQQRTDDRFESTAAAVKLQKVYRSYRTRRRPADSAVVAEQLWWQALDYARLNCSTISFFTFNKPETAASRWSRISLNASKACWKGLCKDANAQKLAFQHWIEAIDPRHCYGHNLKLYYEEWCKEDTGEPFFYWLDIGDGKRLILRIAQDLGFSKNALNILDWSRTPFNQQKINLFHLLSEKEGIISSFQLPRRRNHFGSWKTGGRRRKAQAYSGHYRPTTGNLESFLAFLKQNGVNVDEVQVHSLTEDNECSLISKSGQLRNKFGILTNPEPPKLQASSVIEKNKPFKSSASAQTERTQSYRRTLSSTPKNLRKSMPKKEILQRIKSKKETTSYQLGHQLSLNWSTGAGPRIGCVADYPQKLRVQALEYVNLSPIDAPTTSTSERPAVFTFIRTSCGIM